jgi:putative DNA primase/helicase
MFGPDVANLITTQADQCSAPEDYIAAGILTAASAAIGMSRSVMVRRSFWQPAILWCAVVGMPSSRKTPGLGYAVGYLREIESEIRDAINAQNQRSLEAANRLGSSEQFVGLAQRQMVTVDSTKAALIDLASRNHRLLMFNDEICGLLGRLDRAGTADRAFYLEAYNGRPYRADRKTTGKTDVAQLAISICGGIQPARLSMAVHDDENDGLAARMLWFWPNRRFYNPPGDEPSDDGLKAALWRLASLQQDVSNFGGHCPKAITLSDDAKSEFEQWYMKIDREEDPNPKLAGFMAKRSGLALRLALVTTLLKRAFIPDMPVDPEHIDKQDILDAIEFTEGYASQMARRVFEYTSETLTFSPGGAIARAILQQGMRELNVRELKRGPNIPNLDPLRFDDGIKELEAKGWLRHRRERAAANPGRLRESYDVNPLVWATRGINGDVH